MATTATTAPTAALFDVTEFKDLSQGDVVIEAVELEQLELADNPRKDINPDGIERLALMMMRRGQLVPCIGRRLDDGRVKLYAGQRRYMAAQASHALAGTEGFEGLKALRCLITLLLDHEPTRDEVRAIQAQENAREDLSRRDQQAQFQDCWDARAGMPEDDRIMSVCEDLGISPTQAHNLRRENTLPEEIRARVSDRPSGDQLSVTMAKRLAEMHDSAPQLAVAVAGHITSRDLLDKAQKDTAGFVHKTVIENEGVYAVRVELGRLLDGYDELDRARQHLDADGQKRAAEALSCELDKLDAEMDKFAKTARSKALKITVDAFLRQRAINGGFAYSEDRGGDLDALVWITDPVFVIGLVSERCEAAADEDVAQEEAYFGGAGLSDEEMQQAAAAEAQRRDAERARQKAGRDANLGLGLDIRAKLMEPKSEQLSALRAVCCHLIVEHYRDVIAYGAGWTDQDRQQPIGDHGRFEPRQIDAIVDAELQRALDDADPLRGIAQLVSRLGAAFMLDPDGVTKTKALGSERMARKLRDAVPGGENPLRTALWEFMRPMLSPHLVDLNRDGFVFDEHAVSTVDLDAHRADSDLADLELGDDDDGAGDIAAAA